MGRLPPVPRHLVRTANADTLGDPTPAPWAIPAPRDMRSWTMLHGHAITACQLLWQEGIWAQLCMDTDPRWNEDRATASDSSVITQVMLPTWVADLFSRCGAFSAASNMPGGLVQWAVVALIREHGKDVFEAAYALQGPGAAKMVRKSDMLRAFRNGERRAARYALTQP